MNRARQRNTVAAKVAKVAKVARLAPSVRRTVRAAGSQVLLGRLARWDDDGPLVEIDGGPAGLVRARVAGTGRRLEARDLPAPGQEVVLLVDPRPGQPPIVLGFLQPVGRAAAPSAEIEARIDGRRVELEGRDEIVLRCGAASITLRRNGRIVIHGMQVETRARGLNRIKGGSVAIN
jgi:hypothetical protein